jgi:hypothetical protein
MIFLIIQTIKENTNHNGFVEMMLASSVFGYLFFRKIKRAIKLSHGQKLMLFFGLCLALFAFAFVVKFVFLAPQYVVNGMLILSGLMGYTAMFLAHGHAHKKVQN